MLTLLAVVEGGGEAESAAAGDSTAATAATTTSRVELFQGLPEETDWGLTELGLAHAE